METSLSFTKKFSEESTESKINLYSCLKVLASSSVNVLWGSKIVPNLLLARFLFQIHYHAAFEEAKGQYTAIADDPEILRNIHNTKNISLVPFLCLL